MAGTAPNDQLRERADQSRWKLWLFLEADRLLVTACLVALTFATLVGVGLFVPVPERAIRAGDSIDTLFQGLLTATITGVTLVLTLNQLVLSQELGAVTDQRDRMEGAIQFRADVADAIEASVSPAHPAQFLRALVQVSSDCASTLRDGADQVSDEDATAEIENLTDSLVGNAEQVAAGLDGAQFGSFEVISSALNFNYSWKLFTAQRIHEQYGDALDDQSEETLERLIDVLGLFGPAREYFKTLYFQWELINLSRHILAASVPALLVSANMVLFFDPGRYSVSVLGLDTLVVAVAGATTVVLVPFLILLAYVVRIATVTKHTLSIGPFILRESDDVTEIEWNQ